MEPATKAGRQVQRLNALPPVLATVSFTMLVAA